MVTNTYETITGSQTECARTYTLSIRRTREVTLALRFSPFPPRTSGFLCAVMSSSLPSDPYATLGIARDAQPEEIKAAFHAAALRAHPDKAGEAVRA